MRQVKTPRAVLASFALVALLGFSDTAGAAAEDGSFSVRGIGAQSCGAVVTAFQGQGDRARMAELLGSWIAGYLSHANRTANGVFEVMPVTDMRVVTQLALNVCRANPDSLLEPAVAGLIDSLSAAAQISESPLLEVESDSHATLVRRDVLRLTQQALSQQGLLPPGTADGAYGPQTRQALAAFQQDRGLPETGVPDPVTLINLFVADNNSSLRQ